MPKPRLLATSRLLATKRLLATSLGGSKRRLGDYMERVDTHRAATGRGHMERATGKGYGCLTVVGPIAQSPVCLGAW